MSIATVHYDAIISVTLHADGTSKVEATVTGYDDGPVIHDPEGNTVLPGSDLHSALWNAAAGHVWNGRYPLPPRSGELTADASIASGLDSLAAAIEGEVTA